MVKEEKITVRILPGCIRCGTCQAICPQVFTVNGESQVKRETDMQKYTTEIQEAADMCPVGVIEIKGKTET